jgi:HSP20 family molecular chaperone IbpA
MLPLTIGNRQFRVKDLRGGACVFPLRGWQTLQLSAKIANLGELERVMEFIVRSRVGFEPNADVFVDEGRGQVVVAVEVAGADPESLRVEVDDRSLTIAGLRAEPVRFHRGSFIQKEISYGSFAKRVPLPVAVDLLGDAQANYADGVLVIALPISSTTFLPSTRTEIRMIVKRTSS